jgi:ABC-type phosphate transport system ATPase subunit
MTTIVLSRHGHVEGIRPERFRGRLVETGPAEEFWANPRTPEAKKFIAGELLV